MPTSTGRVLWVTWCLGWSGFWAVLGAFGWPRRVCDQLVVVSRCEVWAVHGSWSALAWCWGAAVVSLAAILLRVGQPRRGKPVVYREAPRYPRSYE